MHSLKEKLSIRANMALVDLITVLINELVGIHDYVVIDDTVVASHNKSFVLFHKFIECEVGTITEVYADGCYGLIGMGKMGRLNELDLSTLVSIYEYLIEYSKDLNGK